jgi:hypothetical protein
MSKTWSEPQDAMSVRAAAYERVTEKGSNPKGWRATGDITEACGECGYYTGHLPSCSHFEK